MKKVENLSELELGNLFFGNSRGVYHVEPREEYQDAFVYFLKNIGFDMYGYGPDNKSVYDCEIFTVRPYYWGEDDSIAELPNFVYKPANLEIKWYKYPMRDAYCNMNVDIDTFITILNECESAYMKENV